jgi:hypothetical protein
MATKAEQFRNEQQRQKAPKAKKAVKASRAERTALQKAGAKDLGPTKSVKGSERVQRNKATTASSRHGRRAG